MPQSMTALAADGYGTASRLELRSVPVPPVGAGQLLVRVAASSANPADLRVLDGELAALSPLTFPHIAGSDMAGTVVAVGDGVTRFSTGDRVFGTGLPRSTPLPLAQMTAEPASFTTGTVAEFAVFEAATPAIAALPDDLDWARAAALPTTGLTALAVLRAADLAKDRPAVVLGAAGGVGSILVPLLASRGADVIAVASAQDVEYLRALGAAQVVDRHAISVPDWLREAFPDGVETLINLALAGDALSGLAPTVAAGGQVISITFPPPDPEVLAQRGASVSSVMQCARPGDLDHLARLAASGELPVSIAARYLLADARSAYLDLGRVHAQGKLVIEQAGQS
jgi:NADPH:quinone reductase